MANRDIVLASIADCFNYQRDKTIYECEQQIAAACIEFRNAVYECKAKTMDQVNRHLHQVRTQKKICLARLKFHPPEHHALFAKPLESIDNYEMKLLNIRRNLEF